MTRSIRNFVGFSFGLIAVAALAVSMQGCKVLESPAAQPFDAIAVGVAVDTVVGTNAATQAARASAVKAIAQKVLAADTGVTATVGNLQALAMAQIAKLNLPPGDAAAADLLVAVLNTAATQYISTLTAGNANVANTEVAVAQVCNWVIAEATRLGAP